MRYEYLILPPAPETWHERMLRLVRVLFQHPGRALVLGLILLAAATEYDAQQAPRQTERRLVQTSDPGPVRVTIYTVLHRDTLPAILIPDSSRSSLP